MASMDAYLAKVKKEHAAAQPWDDKVIASSTFERWEGDRKVTYFILWGRYQKEAESRGLSGKLMAPISIVEGEDAIYKLGAANTLKYIISVDDAKKEGKTWKRIETPKKVKPNPVQLDEIMGITPAYRALMEAENKLFKAYDVLVKNRGKRQLKNPWATTEPYCSALEDEESYKFLDSSTHTGYFDRVSNFDIKRKLHSTDDLNKVAEAWETDTPLAEPITIKFSRMDHETCTYCGDGEYLFDGFEFTAVNECPYPNGIPMTITLDLPSGKLVAGNDFRDKFPGKFEGDEDGDKYYVNTQRGIAGTVEAYEADKMAHFFVGNTSPDLFDTENNTLMVANPAWFDDSDPVEAAEAKRLDSEVKPWGFPATEIGGICTDLWWVSMVDADEAVKRGMDITPSAGPGWTEYVHYDCEPGRYEITYNGLRKDFNRDSDGPTIWATMKRIGDIPNS